MFFFPSDTLIYGISRDGSKIFNIRTCEHMILGQLRMRAGQTKNAPMTSASKVKVNKEKEQERGPHFCNFSRQGRDSNSVKILQ